MAWWAPWWKEHPLKWKGCCPTSLLIQLGNDVIWKPWRPLILEEDLRLSPFTSLEFCLQNTELTVVINHEKMDREDEERKKDIQKPPFLVVFSLTFPSGSKITHLVSERLSWCII